MRKPEGPWARALWVLLPIAAGHLASMAVVVVAVVSGLSMNRPLLHVLALGVLAIALLARLSGRAAASPVGLAAGSFMVCSAHGVGLALVPVLLPLCLSEASAVDFAAWALWAVALVACALLIFIRRRSGSVRSRPPLLIRPASREAAPHPTRPG